MKQIDINDEVLRLHAEIELFRDACLPAMLPDAGCGCPAGDNASTAAGSLSNWREAACRLAEALSSERAVDREEFRGFVYDARSAWRCETGRIHWRIELFTTFDYALVWYPAPKEDQQRLAASADWPREHRLEIEACLLSRGARGGQRDAVADVCALGNALCMLLPWIADVDPDFARTALDKETWRTLVATNHALTANQRGERLRVIDGVFGHILNNALLHVLGTLANNHFLEICDFLAHPNLRGGYTYHMPYYLFTVLFEKSAALLREQFAASRNARGRGAGETRMSEWNCPPPDRKHHAPRLCTAGRRPNGTADRRTTTYTSVLSDIA